MRRKRQSIDALAAQADSTSLFSLPESQQAALHAGHFVYHYAPKAWKPNLYSFVGQLAKAYLGEPVWPEQREKMRGLAVQLQESMETYQPVPRTVPEEERFGMLATMLGTYARQVEQAETGSRWQRLRVGRALVLHALPMAEELMGATAQEDRYYQRFCAKAAAWYPEGNVMQILEGAVHAAKAMVQQLRPVLHGMANFPSQAARYTRMLL